MVLLIDNIINTNGINCTIFLSLFSEGLIDCFQLDSSFDQYEERVTRSGLTILILISFLEHIEEDQLKGNIYRNAYIFNVFFNLNSDLNEDLAKLYTEALLPVYNIIDI